MLSRWNNLKLNYPQSDFAKSLDHLPPVENSDLLSNLKGLQIFLQKSAGQKVWVNRLRSGSYGCGGGTRIHGYVEGWYLKFPFHSHPNQLHMI